MNIDLDINNSIEDLIIDCIDKVTKGIIEDMQISNAYSGWKNTSKGLKLIKNDKYSFYLGVNMWLNITLKQIIGTNNHNELNILSKRFKWLENIFIIIKNK